MIKWENIPNYEFYQHSVEGQEMIFSGRFPGSPIPNFTLKVVVNYFKKMPGAIRFSLVLRNQLCLSIIREKKHSFIEVGQIVNRTLCAGSAFFDHDGYGIATMHIDELPDFVAKIVDTFHAHANEIKGR